ncbi:MAG: AAA family ATPase [Spirochaetales bacterium]|nr:AAA family ATPase [Spirochaetales bacterium]
MIDQQKRIYVAATRQNDGKTITALGLLHALRERFSRVGYMKPVGQQVKLIGNSEIDKDASLIDEVFHIGSKLPDMSPVAVPKGFTKNYILHGEVRHLEKRILAAYQRASEGKDFMVIEGTGHAGVGSVFDLSNAAVARMLKAKMVMVTCAGIGRPIDEVMLNKAVFDAQGVELLGVVVNKVMKDKYDSIDKYVRLGFKRKKIDVLGVIPFYPALSSPTLRQLFEDIHGKLVCGEENLDQSVSKMIVGAMPAHTALDYFKGDVLLITPGNREDLILAAMTCNFPGVKAYGVKGIILTCGIWPNKAILKLVKGTNIPIILVPDDTFTTAQKISNLIIKIRAEDEEKIQKVKEIIKEYVDVGLLLKKLGVPA